MLLKFVDNPFQLKTTFALNNVKTKPVTEVWHVKVFHYGLLFFFLSLLILSVRMATFCIITFNKWADIFNKSSDIYDTC